MKVDLVIKKFNAHPGLIDHMPGLFVVLDLRSHFLAANQVALNWTGFKSHEAMLGTTYFHMPCKASEQHENFIEQDQSILANGGRGKIFGLYCYDNNEWKIILAEKSPIKNENSEVVALISYISDLTHSPIVDVSKFISLTDDGHGKIFKKNQSGFLISDDPKQISLTQRQSECLFFIIRGKTSRDISRILHISPRTVEVFTDQLKNKFSCKTKHELIDKAISLGYLSTIPETLFELCK